VGGVNRKTHEGASTPIVMPMTAAERFLHHPFDPVEVLPKSAEFLRHLSTQFGNLGLAAAAYNAKCDTT
jgi:hypothetical protein